MLRALEELASPPDVKLDINLSRTLRRRKRIFVSSSCMHVRADHTCQDLAVSFDKMLLQAQPGQVEGICKMSEGYQAKKMTSTACSFVTIRFHATKRLTLQTWMP